MELEAQEALKAVNGIGVKSVIYFALYAWMLGPMTAIITSGVIKIWRGQGHSKSRSGSATIPVGMSISSMYIDASFEIEART
ncbi:hypothetical protein GBA52_014399 [Prunus armeniaca]|nr:hypothetical protein GBA52_014399 [Prunus armeniaca]